MKVPARTASEAKNGTLKGCCLPSRAPVGGASRVSGSVPVPVGRDRPNFRTVTIPGGRPIVGTARPRIPNDGEDLRNSRPIKDFQIGALAVTNAEFSAFVDQTGYITEAERIGWSFVFWSDVPSDISETQGVVGIEWWRKVDGANWRDINGPGTWERSWKPDHPVVQVSWNDANAFAAWAGGRLPTEAEWEHSARGGLGDVPYPWGERDPDDADYMPCNIWQGAFPDTNTGADGYARTAPAESFQPNGYGLYNTVGNVWEWTSDPYRIPSLKRSVKEKLKAMVGYKVAKGGSFLCHRTYCWRYRVAARSGNSPDSATPHIGFRLVFNTKQTISDNAPSM